MRSPLPRVPALAALALALVACSSDDESSPGATTTTEPPLPGPPEWNRDVTPPDDADAEAARAACAYEAGALPAETQGASHPSGKAIPIDHIVVLMMENRSFDHYFQKLPEYGQPDVEVAPATFTNPDTDGNPVGIFHDTQYCFVDTNHEWDGSHQQFGDGKMDGFFVTNDGWSEKPPMGDPSLMSGKRALGYYDETDLPFYYWLASEFAIADHYHCSLLGPTWPNRMFLYAATSFGRTENVVPETAGANVIWDNLELREIDWRMYGDGIAGPAVVADKFLPYAGKRASIDEFFAAAAAGTLPQVAFVDPKLGDERYDQDDEHPPAMAQIGERFAARVIEALTKSPSWSRSALFLTYDEHGGLYDHVPPPKACEPDDKLPILDPPDPAARFDRYGFRVPLTVVSPYAKKHFVGHRVYDHTSIVRFIEARFVMPAMTARDANAEAPWELFDFEAAPHATPPAVTVPEVPADALAKCKQIFGG